MLAWVERATVLKSPNSMGASIPSAVWGEGGASETHPNDSSSRPYCNLKFGGYSYFWMKNRYQVQNGVDFTAYSLNWPELV